MTCQAGIDRRFDLSRASSGPRYTHSSHLATRQPGTGLVSCITCQSGSSSAVYEYCSTTHVKCHLPLQFLVNQTYLLVHLNSTIPASQPPPPLQSGSFQCPIVERDCLGKRRSLPPVPSSSISPADTLCCKKIFRRCTPRKSGGQSE
jgi:hypothetical protein